MERFKKAKKDLDKAIKLDANLAEAYLQRGITLYNLDDAINGCNDLERALNLGIKEAEELISKYCREIN
jgi:tetratricopeptide (TPR) repeat protein